MDTSPEPIRPTTTRRRPLAIAVGVTTLALAGAVLVNLPSTAAVEMTGAGPMLAAHETGQMGTAERMQRRGQVDPVERAARMAEMAERFGVDADELTAALDAMRADLAAERAAAREALMELEPGARRTAMREFAHRRREAMAAVLETLGVDPAALAQHRAEHGADRGPQHRGGPGMHR
jgi:hypothetical protein